MAHFNPQTFLDLTEMLEDVSVWEKMVFFIIYLKVYCSIMYWSIVVLYLVHQLYYIQYICCNIFSTLLYYIQYFSCNIFSTLVVIYLVFQLYYIQYISCNIFSTLVVIYLVFQLYYIQYICCIIFSTLVVLYLVHQL